MIPVNAPLLKGNERKYVQECISTGWISSDGPFLKRFEEAMSAKMGRKFGIAVCNGTAALEVATVALGIRKDDEVILPTFTIISCAAAIVRVGGKPVLVDSDLRTWNMNVHEIENKINSKTKAIMVVHTYGLPVDVDPIINLAKKYRLAIIEDAAEQQGQTYKGKKVGSFGDVSVYSFYANKHITSGEGGMILTDNEEIAKKCRSLRNLCFVPERRFIHYELGYNFRLTNLQAAVGLAQLEQLEITNKKKRLMGKKYTEMLKDIPVLRLPIAKTDFAENIYWVYGMVIDGQVPFSAKEAMRRLAGEGIDCRPFFYPMHLQPVFQKMGLFKGELYPMSEMLAERGFYIPSGVALTEREMTQVSEAVHKIFLRY
jgi:perosamine synthetase